MDIARVHVGSWQETYEGIVDPEFLAAMSVNARLEHWSRMLEEGPPPWVHVAVDPLGRLIGFASGGPSRQPYPGFSGELYAIYIRKEAQRMGMGRRLVERVAQDMKLGGVGSMLVWVLEQNPYRRFYAMLGGEVVGQQTLSIGSREHPIVAYGWRDLDVLLARTERAR
jgi:GNAT superfamily N-acetyltransferase